MAHRRAVTGQAFLVRMGILIVACTAALTLSFVGLVAFATGEAVGVIDRVPFYVLGMAVVFVATVIGLERDRRDGRSVLVAAATLAGAAFVFFTLGGEGFVYAARNPGQALAAQRFLYLVAAGLIGTGVGYWGLRYRADVVRSLR